MNDSQQQQQPRLISQCTYSSKRVRAARSTSLQTEALVAAVETKPFLATRRFNSLQGKENFESTWLEVTADLNSMINGAVKSPEQWLTVWRDLKSRACMKAAKRKKEKFQTGNLTPKTPPLTELEKRIVSLIGVDYTLGTKCPDSMPEEEMLQRDLEAGVDVDTSYYVDISQSDFNSEFVEESSELAELTEIPQTADSAQCTEVENEPTSMPRSRKNKRNLNPRRSVAEQYASAKSDFLTISKSHAESMRILASTAKQQAEAAKVQAEASLLFAQAVNKIADAILAEKKL